MANGGIIITPGDGAKSSEVILFNEKPLVLFYHESHGSRLSAKRGIVGSWEEKWLNKVAPITPETFPSMNDCRENALSGPMVGSSPAAYR